MRYVVASDGSEASLKAARWLARRCCPGPADEVFVIYVFPLPPDLECYDGVVALPTDGGDERVRRVAAGVLERTADALTAIPSRVEQVILVGNPGMEIVELATNQAADLIVIGTRGHSVEHELYLGSVSSAVAHRAPCSVLIVR